MRRPVNAEGLESRRVLAGGEINLGPQTDIFDQPYVQIDNLHVALAVVPEPATVLLLGSGLAAIGALGWRRRRQGAA